MSQENLIKTKHTVVVKSTKSVGLSVVLALFFGPLGMFYSTIVGAVVMLIVNLAVAVFTAGIGLLFTWPVCMLWAGIATSNHNNSL